MVFFLPQLTSSGVPFYRDTLVSQIPWRHFIRQELLAGRLPHWFPYEGLGVPFIGQIAPATFHPQTLLFLPLPAALAVKWNLLCAYLLGLVGAYRAARALALRRTSAVGGAFAFAFGGYALGIAHNLQYVTPLCTLPWVLAFAARLGVRRRVKDAVVLGAAWGLLFLGGDPQAFAFAPLLILAALVAVSAPLRLLWRHLLAAFGLAVALSAIELLPATAVAADSVRAAGDARDATSTVWALHPWRALELLSTGLVPDEVRNDVVRGLFGGTSGLWATSIFAGACALLLAALSLTPAMRKRAWPFCGVALLGVWLALGAHGGLLPVLLKVTPLIDRFRYPEKYLSLTAVTLSVLTAFGMEALQTERRRALFAGGILAAVSSAMGFAWTPATLRALWSGGSPTDELLSVVADAGRAGFFRAAVFAALATLLFFLSSRRRMEPLLCLLLLGELLVNQHQLPLVPRAVVEERPSTAAALPVLDYPVRVMASHDVRVLLAPTLPTGAAWTRAVRESLRSDTSALEGINALGLNLPAAPLRYALALGGTRDTSLLLAGRFGACHRTFPVDELHFGVSPLTCRARAELVHAISASSSDEAAQKLHRGEAATVIEGGEGPLPQGTVTLVQYSAGEVTLRTASAEGGHLILREQFARGWRARVDGAAVPVLSADVAAMAVAVPAGEHEVVFHYSSPRFAAGAALTLATLLAAAFALWRGRSAVPRESIHR